MLVVRIVCQALDFLTPISRVWHSSTQYVTIKFPQGFCLFAPKQELDPPFLALLDSFEIS
jgi:hypothetical protein